MGVWGDDFFNGDSTIEVAKELLDVAGIGPKNFKSGMLHMTATGADGAHRFTSMRAIPGAEFDPPLNVSKGEVMFMGRHSPIEYEEFAKCWDAAKHEYKALEKNVMKLYEVAQSHNRIHDRAGPERPIFGHGQQLLALLLTQAGCALPSGLKQARCLQALRTTNGPRTTHIRTRGEL